MANEQEPEKPENGSSASISGASPSTTSPSTSSATSSPATAALQAAATASTTSDQQKQRDAVLACLLQGLATIGINAQAATVIVFSAINSDALCATLAHA